MSNLPHSATLPVHHLAASFDNVTNSYKFYWFLAILDAVKEGDQPFIPLNLLLAKMVAGVWYPTNYFYLSFGKQDRLSQIALKLKDKNALAIDTKSTEIVDAVLAALLTNSPLSKEILSLGRFVPYRFLRPFFASELRGIKDYKIDSLIEDKAAKNFVNTNTLPLYRFVDTPGNGLELQPDWFEYFKQHLNILQGFCLWHLLNYLQKNNPNAPNLASKLFEPEKRKLNKARNFWQLVFDQAGTIDCIYSSQTMSEKAFSLDHFLPWRFVTHDLLWNIIPTPRNINSAKSDNLPRLDLYFDSFAALQYQAVQMVIKTGKTKLLEDYALLLKKGDVTEIKGLSADSFATTLHDTMAPQIQIAKNMGFTADWSYSAL